MIKILKMVSLATVAAMTAVATTQAATSTNVLVNVSFQLTVYSPGPTNQRSGGTTTKIATSTLTTQGLIAALGQDQSITSKPFSSSAILALATDATNLAGIAIPTLGLASLVVVDGDNIVPIPLSVMNVVPIVFLNPSATLASVSVSLSGRTVAVSQSFFSAGSLNINVPNQWALQLSGTGTTSPDKITVGKGKGASAVDVYTGSADLSGYGTMGAAGTPVIVTGKVTQTYLKTLVQ